MINLAGAPRLAVHVSDREYLRDAAIHVLRGREETYPSWVNTGKMPAEDAAEKLERSRAIVAQWRWATDPAAPTMPNEWWAPFRTLNRILADELAEIAARQRDRAGRAGDRDASELADLCDALAWCQADHDGTGIARIVWRVSAERDLTAARAVELQKAA